jgi:hypothetical protein
MSDILTLPKNKHLTIFDFDETLCNTNGLISRYDREKDVLDKLTPFEYSTWREQGEYDLNPRRWHLDFSDFRGFPKNGTVIAETINKLRDYLNDAHYVCVLVTGRDELSGPKEFLMQNYIDVNRMILMCTGDPNKTHAYESLVNTFEPSSITIYEDNPANIDQCENVCAKYRIPCASVLIGDGKINWNWKIKGAKNVKD